MERHDPRGEKRLRLFGVDLECGRGGGGGGSVNSTEEESSSSAGSIPHGGVSMAGVGSLLQLRRFGDKEPKFLGKMAESSNRESSDLMSKAINFLATETSEEVAIAIDPLFTCKETSEYKAARALYECCVAYFSNTLIPKLLATYQHTSNGVLRFRLIHLVAETLPGLRKRNFQFSSFVLRKIKRLVISCLKMRETRESDIRIFRRIVSFVAHNVVMSNEGGWNELSDCILEFANSNPFKAFHVFLDLPLTFGKFINQFVMMRVLDKGKMVLLSLEKGSRVQDWSLALVTVFKIGVQFSDSQSDVERIVLESANKVVEEGMEEFLGTGLEDVKMFLARDGNVCRYNKDQRVFVSELVFNIATHYKSIKKSEKFVTKIVRVVRNPKKYMHYHGSWFDIDWCDHLKNLSSLEVLNVYVKSDLGDRSRELAIRRLEALLSDQTSSFLLSSHISVTRRLQQLLIFCLEEEGISESMFKVLGKVVNQVSCELLIFKNETWKGLRDYLVSKSQTEFKKAVYIFQCLTMPFLEDGFVIPVVENLLPEINVRLNPPRELLVDNSLWVLAFAGAFCTIIHLIDRDTHDEQVKEIAYKMIDSVRELVERKMEVGLVRRAFRDVESIVKKQLGWYNTSEYKFVKGLLWRLYEIKGMKMESKMVLWRINVIMERGVDELEKELPESELHWLNQPEEDSELYNDI